MKLLITGGGGFVGARLARTLLARGRSTGQPVEPPRARRPRRAAGRPADPHPRVASRIGALASHSAMRWAAKASTASSTSLRRCPASAKRISNWAWLPISTVRARCSTPCARPVGRGDGPARLVFSSSVAVFGPDPRCHLPTLVGDDTLPAPKTSYGAQKLVCEHLVADYSRKGFIDGRSARLMTVTVRPGRPNGAASSFFSGIIREPLAGVESVCPVSPDVSHPVPSRARTVDGLIAVFEATSRRSAAAWRSTCRPQRHCREMLAALEEVAGPEVRQRVRFVRDETIAGIVANWPRGSTAARAAKLGLHADPSFADIIRQYIADCRASPDGAAALKGLAP